MNSQEVVQNLRKETREKNAKKYQNDSKQRLNKIINTKMRTAFIGSLDAFERAFGYLWGIDKDSEGPLTKEEDAMLQLWLLTRNKVLTNGNNQLRALENELEQYTVNWDRYQTVIRVEN